MRPLHIKASITRSPSYGLASPITSVFADAAFVRDIGGPAK